MNITVMDKTTNPLKKTDHAIRIVDQGKVPDGKGGFRPKGVVGRAGFGENYVYISAHILNRKEDATGKYKGKGKTSTGLATLTRTSAHEMGHSGNLKHPKSGTMKGNLMHQTKSSYAGMDVKESQILEIEKAYKAKKLNKGKQKL